jgi:nicotinate-nucleotide adenylyltransferase
VARSIDILDWVHQNYELTDKPGLVIGDDLFEGFRHWNDPEAILTKAELLIAHRLYPHKVKSPFPHRYLDNRIYPVSSSEIREEFLMDVLSATLCLLRWKSILGRKVSIPVFRES